MWTSFDTDLDLGKYNPRNTGAGNGFNHTLSQANNVFARAQDDCIFGFLWYTIELLESIVKLIGVDDS